MATDVTRAPRSTGPDMGGCAGGAVQYRFHLLARDRPRYLREALDSILAQETTRRFSVVVSDNSETSSVQEVMRSEYPDVACIRRAPPLSSRDHFNKLFKEASSEFVVFFHDDDILSPNYLEVMSEVFNKHPGVVAVGCNAQIMRDDRRTDRTVMRTGRGRRTVTLANDLFGQYASIDVDGPPPFSGYMYRRASMANLTFGDGLGGKHADVVFLLDLLRRGPICWESKPLMYCRIHSGHDSARESIGDRLELARLVYSHAVLPRRSRAAQSMRFVYWYRWWKQEGKGKVLRSPKNRRESIVLRFLCTSGVTFAFSGTAFWRRIAQIVTERFRT